MISSVPIYDYVCDHCGHAFSSVQSFTDPAVDVCPSCGKRPRKLLTAPAIVFKGSGWYKTDSRPQPKGDAAKVDGSTKGDASAKAESKSDTKGDTKSDTSGSSGKSEAAP